MSKQIDALKLALDALERLDGWLALRYGSGLTPQEKQTATAIKEALAQPEQEPVAWRAWFDADNSAKWLFTLWPEEEHPSFDWQPLYTHPPVPTAQPKEPLVINSQEKASEFIEKTLWEVIDVAAMFPKAKPDPRTWEHLMVYSPQPKEPEQEPVAWRYKPAREDNPRWEYTTNHPLDMGDGYIRPSLVEYCKCIEPLYAKEKPKLMLEKFREMDDLLEEPAQQEPATKEKIREAIVFNLPLYTTPPQRTWVGLNLDERAACYEKSGGNLSKFTDQIEAKLKEKNGA